MNNAHEIAFYSFKALEAQNSRSKAQQRKWAGYHASLTNAMHEARVLVKRDNNNHLVME